MATFKYRDDVLQIDVEPQTHYQRIFIKLQEKGYDVYPPSRKRDKCKKPYVVISEMGTYSSIDGNVNGYNLVNIFCYMPDTNYSNLEGFVENIKSTLLQLDFMYCTGNQSPILEFSEINAYGQSVEYQIFRQIKKLGDKKYE